MKIAIMQPYFLPYIGYWSLIHAVDRFIIFDDVNYIKKGYINRNSISLNGTNHTFTLELIGASQNKLIKDIEVGGNRTKILKTIQQAYSKYPFYEDFMPLLECIIIHDTNSLSDYISNSIIKISEYLELPTHFSRSSEYNNNKALRGQDKIIELAKINQASHYINSIGGTELYQEEEFHFNEINLLFLKPHTHTYRQPTKEFIPYLSIIDAIFNVGKDETKKLISRYEFL